MGYKNKFEVDLIMELIDLIKEQATAEEVKKYLEPDQDFKMSARYKEYRLGEFLMPNGHTLKVITDPFNDEYEVRFVPKNGNGYTITPLLGMPELQMYIDMLKTKTIYNG